MFGLEIENFRSFKKININFEKVNILIGENSSGKSSLIKFILLLSRSVNLYDKNFIFSNELGKFNDFVHEKKEENIISFTISYGSDYSDFFLENFKSDEEFSTICDEISLIKEEFQNIELTFSFSKDVNLNNQVDLLIKHKYFGSLKLNRTPQKKGHIYKDKLCDLLFTDEEGNIFEFKEISYDQNGFLSFVHSKALNEYISLNYSDDDYLFYVLGFLLISQNFLIEELGKISYINPLDSIPERTYGDLENLGIYPVKNIKDVVNILSDESIPQENRDSLLKKLNLALHEYGLLNEIKIENNGYGTNIVSVKLTENGIWSNIKDVGYGTSLQIPIFFQAIIGETLGGEIIIIEQPEIHIHPYLQSKFIETLLKIGTKNTYIIETHSEDIVRKLQVMVKKEEFVLSTKDVSINYFKKNIDNQSINSIHIINKFGKLTPPFPSGFYDSSSNLVKELF